MWRRKFLLTAVVGLFLVPDAALSQTTPVEGLRESDPGVHALVGARIAIAPGQLLPSGTLIVRDGIIDAVGPGVTPPLDAVIHDVSGLTIYAGFLDPYTSVGMRRTPEPQEERARGAIPWNPQLRPHMEAAAQLSMEEDELRLLRSQGFTVAHAVPRLGLFRGASAVVSLEEGPARERVLRSGLAQSVTLSRDVRVGDTYPTSPMGAIALIRQTLLDADWLVRASSIYDRDPEGMSRPESNRALEALAGVVGGETPLLFEATSHEEVLRVLRIREEFPIDVWIRGSGHEYRLEELQAGWEVPLILPLAFPPAPAVEAPDEALDIGLAELRHWYLAGENPARLTAAGVEYSFTSDGLADPRDFLENVRHAVVRGLDPEVALAAVTLHPARLLGLERSHGTLEAGKAANLVVSEGDLFREDVPIREVWVDGRRHSVTPVLDKDPRGRWNLVATTIPNSTFGLTENPVGSVPEGTRGPEARDEIRGVLTVEGQPGDLSGTLTVDGRELPVPHLAFTDGLRRLRGSFSGLSFESGAPARFTASLSGQSLRGWLQLSDGGNMDLRGERISEPDGERAGAVDEERPHPRVPPPFLNLPPRYPPMEYGRNAPPEQPTHLLVRNATIWTVGPQGVLHEADLLIREGRVAEVGRNLSAPPQAVVVDAAGKHVTPGLIDTHFHSGFDGPSNETGGAVVPEVRLGDILVEEDIWTYRVLAGGLTTAHVMHGSANPIGGQNQVVKMRWGLSSEERKFRRAPRTVKFALGENAVGRSDRYPNTRMGTHQIIRDHFLAAREYRRAWREWEADPRGLPPRRDLRLEALAEVLEEEIQIQAHGYRHDEFLMLIALSREFDVPIKAIHHGVEAYKIAPELAAAGVAATVWTDRSSYKLEAYDATSYNARILHDAGVVTSLHSDSQQIARRMNWEAAKLLRVGMDEEDSLATVTIQAARALGIEEWVGSLEPGKDADFVIWSGHPLSASTRPEQTWVDGRRYFDLEEDRHLRTEVAQERAQLIQAVLNHR